MHKESHPASRAAGSPRWVRIRRSEIGERLAQQDILQAESVRILAKGEIPVFRFGLTLLYRKRTGTSNEVPVLFLLPHTRNLTRRVEPQARLAGFAFAARRSESGLREISVRNLEKIDLL